MELITPRLILRPARESDAEDVHGMLSDPLYRRYLATLPHQTLDETRAWVAAMMAATPEDGCEFMIEYQGRAIGRCGVWRWPEMGYGIAPRHWGKGLVSEALTAVTAHIVAIRSDLPAITADVDPNHKASIAVLTKLGFKQTGSALKTYQLGERWFDSAYFALARPGT